MGTLRLAWTGPEGLGHQSAPNTRAAPNLREGIYPYPTPWKCYIKADIQNAGLDDNPQFLLRSTLSYGISREYDLIEFSVSVAAAYDVYPRVIQSKLGAASPGLENSPVSILNVPT